MQVSSRSAARPHSRSRRLPLSVAFSVACLLGSALLGSLAATPVHAQRDELPWSASRGEDLVIKLVTFGPGDDVYNYFGHNAMVVQDRLQGTARLYNYGMFHFGFDMLPNYMKGRLTFWVGEAPVHETFAFYEQMNRSVRVQVLNLAPEQRVLLARALQTAVLPSNRDYLYHHYFNNCSTKLRDLVDQALGGQFKLALAQPARMSYREHTRRYAQQDPFIDMVLVFWMNDQMEAPIKQWDELFLPEELERQVARMQFTNAQGQRVPLVASAYTVYRAHRAATPERPQVTWPFTLLIGVGLAGLAWLTSRWMLRARGSLPRRFFGAQHALIGLLFGLPGLLGFLMWTLTEHTVTYRNENQLLANPLTFLMLPLGIAIAFGSRAALRWCRYLFYVLAASSCALVVLKLLPSFDQDTILPMTLILPANVGYALAHRALALQPSAAAAPATAPSPVAALASVVKEQ